MEAAVSVVTISAILLNLGLIMPLVFLFIHSFMMVGIAKGWYGKKFPVAVTVSLMHCQRTTVLQYLFAHKIILAGCNNLVSRFSIDSDCYYISRFDWKCEYMITTVQAHQGRILGFGMGGTKLARAKVLFIIH